MFEKLFPKTIDNQYRGMAIAKWAFPDGGAQSIATIVWMHSHQPQRQ